MTLTNLLSKFQKFTVDNSPTILTGVAAVGVVTTAYLTGRASFRAAQIIQDEEFQLSKERSNEILDNRAKLELVWTMYLPAVGVGAVTIAAIIGSNRIGARRAAAVAAAYSITEKAFSDYRDKVVEKFGKTKETQVRDEVAQDAVKENPVVEREVIITGGEVLCYDGFTGRYFKSDMETLKKAQNDLNYRILNDYYASLTDFYNLIGLPSTSYSDEVGWNCDELMELEFSTVLSEDERPCIAINFRVIPIRGYHRIN